MDTRPKGRSRRPGGTVEPANRAKVAREVFQMPQAAAGGHALSSSVTRSPKSRTASTAFKDMVTKADQLGATRFHAVAPDGT